MNPRIITRGDLRAELWLGDCREVLPKRHHGHRVPALGPQLHRHRD